MVVDEPAAWCFDNASAVGGGVVRIALAESDSLGHCWRLRDDCQYAERLDKNFDARPQTRALTFEDLSEMVSNSSRRVGK